MRTIESKIVYLQGGLGNQLFQYAFFEYLRKIEREVDIYLEFGRLNYDKQHGGITIASLLDLDNSVLKNSDLDSLPNVINDLFSSKITRKLLRIINRREFGGSYYDFDAMSSLAMVNFSKNNFVGYFQFAEAAIKTKPFLESQIYKKNKRKIEFFKSRFCDHVALHVRRGDFITSRNVRHAETSESIIFYCLSKFKDRNVLICSDDIDWCKSKLSDFDNITFFSGDSAIDDFLALSQCSDSITLGSTFSWWSSFLFSENSDNVYAKASKEIQYLTEDSISKLNWSLI